MKIKASELQCPFCQPGIRRFIYYKNNGYLAVVNIAPVLPGHSLVIPEHHKTTITSLDAKELQLFMQTAQKATFILMKAFGTDAFDWSVQEKPEAGQSIEHLHMHIVPRLKNDLEKPGDWYPLVHKNDIEIIDSMNRPKLGFDELRKIVDKLKEVAGNMML
ncbi:MAG: HIT domain-containing protein [Bacteroidales bacterium]|nr:HIT domain-containing protein [Bacteroidales bacterium]